MSPAARVGIGAVRVYQWTFASVLGGQCRFAPTCSEYAVEALRRHGAVRGTGLAAWRVLRCQPWCDGGYDPVPEHGWRAAPASAETAPEAGIDGSAKAARDGEAGRSCIEQAGH